MPYKPEDFALQNVLQNHFNKIKYLIILYLYKKDQPQNG